MVVVDEEGAMLKRAMAILIAARVVEGSSFSLVGTEEVEEEGTTEGRWLMDMLNRMVDADFDGAKQDRKRKEGTKISRRLLMNRKERPTN